MDQAAPELDQARMRFYADMANGLHAIAQPLTVVRGALGALTLRMGATPDYGHYLDMSTRQVERICELTLRLQRRLEAEQFEANLVIVDLTELIAPIIEDMDILLQGSGVGICLAKPDRATLILGDRDRTEQAFKAVLQAAASISSAGDLIELHLLPRQEFVELSVENRSKHGTSLSSSDRLGLSLAEANIRTQNGLYKYTEDPLQISLALPAHHPAATAALHCT